MPLALLLALLAAAATEAPPADAAPIVADTATAPADAAPAPAVEPAPAAPTAPEAVATPLEIPSPAPVAAPAPASAAALPNANATVTPSDAPRALRPLAIGLSFVPVLALGHCLSGDSKTAKRLLLVSGAGVVAAGAGAAMLFKTTGNRDLAPVGMALLFAGVSTLLGTWLGDVVGTLRPEGQVTAFHREDSLTAALLYGPSLAHAGNVKHLGILRAEYENPKVLLDGWGSLAPGTRYQELHLRGGVKIYGDGKRSHVALVAEGLRELGGDSDSSGHGGALMFEGRLDAGVLDKSMSGLVLVQRLGGGVIAYSYDGTSATDLQPFLVLETGLSIALTDWFEVSAVYSQRPDKRLGMVFDHGGHGEVQVRIEVHPKVRLVALTHIGGGMDVMAGAEVVAW
ncbi:MAG TPA: hypothetical protein VGK67_15255 [Myxococcales bacterium]|jgi:hypothetical protein